MTTTEGSEDQVFNAGTDKVGYWSFLSILDLECSSPHREEPRDNQSNLLAEEGIVELNNTTAS